MRSHAKGGGLVQCGPMSKGSFTPSDSIMVTAKLTGGTFDLAKQKKGAAHQRYGGRDVIAQCEQILREPGPVPRWEESSGGSVQ